MKSRRVRGARGAQRLLPDAGSAGRGGRCEARTRGCAGVAGATSA